MEYKIGEIFEYNGEWYQCLKSPDGSCKHCDMNFGGKCPIPIKECVASARSDLSYVIFKKLEKVGEPYMDGGKTMQKYKRVYREPIYFPYKELNCYNDLHGRICIEIKQTKEDMEEKKQKIDDLVGLYSSAKITYKEFDKRLKALYNKQEENKPVLNPFNLEAAKQGKPVYTRDGRKARIICFDRNDLYPIIALIECKDGKEVISTYSKEGETEIYEIKGTDLMMFTEKKEGWVNVYRDCDGVNITKDDNIYSSKDAAIASAQIIDRDNYVATTIIKWEE